MEPSGKTQSPARIPKAQQASQDENQRGGPHGQSPQRQAQQMLLLQNVRKNQTSQAPNAQQANPSLREASPLPLPRHCSQNTMPSTLAANSGTIRSQTDLNNVFSKARGSAEH